MVSSTSFRQTPPRRTEGRFRPRPQADFPRVRHASPATRFEGCEDGSQACRRLRYLGRRTEAGITVEAYEDEAAGLMIEQPDGCGLARDVLHCRIGRLPREAPAQHPVCGRRVIGVRASDRPIPQPILRQSDNGEAGRTNSALSGRTPCHRRRRLHDDLGSRRNHGRQGPVEAQSAARMTSARGHLPPPPRTPRRTREGRHQAEGGVLLPSRQASTLRAEASQVTGRKSRTTSACQFFSPSRSSIVARMMR